MPATFHYVPGLRLAEMRFEGKVAVEDIRSATAGVLTHPQFGPDIRLLVDARGMEPTFSSGDIVLYQEWRKQHPQFAKIAIVAATDFEFGFARMFELATNSVGTVEMHIFRDVAAARQWLGLPNA